MYSWIVGLQGQNITSEEINFVEWIKAAVFSELLPNQM